MSHIILGHVAAFQEKSAAKDQGILGKLKCAINIFSQSWTFSFEHFGKELSSVQDLGISQNRLFVTFALRQTWSS